MVSITGLVVTAISKSYDWLYNGITYTGLVVTGQSNGISYRPSGSQMSYVFFTNQNSCYYLKARALKIVYDFWTIAFWFEINKILFKPKAHYKETWQNLL